MIGQVVLGLLISYVVLFVLSLILKDNSIADIFWGLAFLQIMIHSFILSNSAQATQLFLLVLISVWALRISGYILSKKFLHKGEDRRYLAWRKTWKYFYVRSFFQVYILQGVLALIIAIPLLLINFQPLPLSPLFFIGVAMSVFGLIFETIADMQLRNFVKKNKGKLMTKGLWKYSRHPNYFGEIVFWHGMMVSTVSISVLAVVSFLLILFLLRYVSGVPLAEERYKHNKEFQAYKAKTPAITPNFTLK